MKLSVTEVWEKNWDAIHATDENGERLYKYIINTGSSRSSKTYSLIDCYDLYAKAHSNKRMTVWRSTRKDCKDTVMLDFLKRMKTTGRYSKAAYNITESVYRYDNGSRIEFRGADDEGVFGLTQDVAWLNEPYSISKDIFDDIDQRTSDFIFIDWNPKENHYIDQLCKHPRAFVIHSTFRDNPFCPPEQRMKIESYEPTPENIANGTANKYRWDVFGLGIKGEIEGLAITGWEQIDGVPGWAKLYGYGMDFGYTNDPTTLIALYHDTKMNRIVADEVIYSTGLKNRMIFDAVIKAGIRPSELIVADSADPKSIDDLYDYGLINIQPAKKGSDSIRYGIGLINDHKLYVTARSKNLIFELENYKNAKDKYGSFINEPEKNQRDHAIDALRYILMDKKSRIEHFVL